MSMMVPCSDVLTRDWPAHLPGEPEPVEGDVRPADLVFDPTFAC
jgi:hypothetical protein